MNRDAPRATDAASHLWLQAGPCLLPAGAFRAPRIRLRLRRQYQNTRNQHRRSPV